MKGASKNVVIGVLVLAALVGGFVLMNGGVAFQAVTVADACTQAQSYNFSIACVASPTPGTFTVTASVHPGTAFNITSPGAVVESSVRTSGSLYYLWDVTLGRYLCTATGNCDGQVLTMGHSYLFNDVCSYGPCAPHSTLTIVGQTYNLNISDTLGHPSLAILNTTNCATPDLPAAIVATPALAATYSSKVDINVPVSVSLQPGQSLSFTPGVYRTITPVATLTVDGKPALCNAQTKLVTGFRKESAHGGACYAIQDTSVIIRDGTAAQYFACHPTECQSVHGLNSSYQWVDFQCQLIQSPAPNNTNPPPTPQPTPGSNNTPLILGGVLIAALVIGYVAKGKSRGRK